MQTFKTSRAKENMLRKIRMALQEESLPQPYPEVEKVEASNLFKPSELESLEEQFAVSFSQTGGKFIYCSSQQDLIENLRLLAESRGWSEVLCAHRPLFSFLINNKINFVREFNPHNEQAQACITDCETAIARTGSLMFSSKQNHGRVAPIYFPVHIVVLQPHQIVQDISDGLKLMKQKYTDMMPSMINLNTGPSRTADIEKTLVTGVHGPKEIFCFLLGQ